MSTLKKRSAAEIIAWTFGWDIQDVRDGLYQRFKNPSVYVCGDDYYSVHKSKPKHDVGAGWEPYPEQFACEGGDRTLWVSKAITRRE
jgi:peptide methionine sulfoxide reductase MsrB